ncbi:hypothetical protein G6F32_016708 [Rhizopus arrhizus]|nr:hypothetical protein G6F32_016708 [Rhizopus arrhizus]
MPATRPCAGSRSRARCHCATSHRSRSLRSGAAPVQEAGESSTLISLAAAGLGAAILPSSCDHIRVEGARFVALADAGAHSEVQLAWRREGVTPLIRNFATLLREAFAEG